MFNINDDDIFDFEEDFLQNAFKIPPQKTSKEQIFETKHLSLRGSSLSKENHILNVQSNNSEKNKHILKSKTNIDILQNDKNDHIRTEHTSSSESVKLKPVKNKYDHQAIELVPGSSKEVTSEICSLESKIQREKGFKKQLPFILSSTNDDLDSLFDLEFNNFKTKGYQQSGKPLCEVSEANQHKSKICNVEENIKSSAKNPSGTSAANTQQYSEGRKFSKLIEEKNVFSLPRKGFPPENFNLSVLPSAVSISRKTIDAGNNFTPSNDFLDFAVATKTKDVTDLKFYEEQRKNTSPTFSSPIYNQSPYNKSFKTRKRKFPGPAGILPKLPVGANLPSVSQSESPITISESKVPGREDFPCSQASVEEFQKPPWLNMLKDLDCKPDDTNSLIDRFNIAWVLQQAAAKQLPKGKVPVLCVIIKLITYEGSEASVVFKDKTGEMGGTVHRKLLEEYQQNIEPGAVLVLKQVSVFSPSTRKHYLNVTPNNIVSMYGIQGVKTCVVDCSGYQLAAMGEEWMLESALLNAANKGTTSSPFSTNKYSPLFTTPQSSGATISRRNSGLQVKPGKLSMSATKLYGPSENKHKDVLPQEHSFASTSFIANNDSKKSCIIMQNSMIGKKSQNSAGVINISAANTVQSEKHSSHLIAGVKSTDLDVSNNAYLDNREVNTETMRSSGTCIVKSLSAKSFDASSGLYQDKKNDTIAVSNVDDIEDELFEDDLDSLLLTIDDQLF